MINFCYIYNTLSETCKNFKEEIDDINGEHNLDKFDDNFLQWYNFLGPLGIKYIDDFYYDWGKEQAALNFEKIYDDGSMDKSCYGDDLVDEVYFADVTHYALPDDMGVLVAKERDFDEE